MLSCNQLLGCFWGNMLNRQMLITVLLLSFLLEGQKELHEEVKSWWSAQRSFNWQHFISYLMPQTTDLFCQTILIFAKSSMLISFNPLLRKYWGNTYPQYPNMIFQLSKGIVFPLKYEGTFFLKKKTFFIADGGTNFFLGKLMGGCCSTWGIND